MLKRKLATIAVLIALILTALGLRFATVSRADASSTYTTPADPIVLPISPPPH